MEKVAAVILDHNDHLNALRLVSQFKHYEILTKIAVVDNSPQPAGAAFLREAEDEKVEYLRVGNDGYAAGNNAGVRLLEEKFGPFDAYLISNTDVEVRAQAIERCAAALRDDASLAVAAPQMYRPDGTPHPLTGWRERTLLCDLAYSSGILSRLLGMYRETYPPAYFETPVSYVDCVAGAFFMVRGAAFRQVGYFDPATFLYYEEDILGKRLRDAGYRLAVLNGCRYIHYEGVAVRRSVNLLGKYRMMQKSRIYFQRHYQKISPVGCALLYAATALGFAEKALRTAQAKLGRFFGRGK